MFATLALRSIKCVNRNLLGIWNFRMHIHDLLRATPSDSGRPVLAGLVQFRLFDRWFPCLLDLDSLLTGPRGVLFGAIPLIRGNGCGPCVPPLYFCPLQIHVPRRHQY
jgi:hypothetical protein